MVARKKTRKKKTMKRSGRLHATEQTPTQTNCKNVTPKNVKTVVDTKGKEVRKLKDHVVFVEVTYKNQLTKSRTWIITKKLRNVQGSDRTIIPKPERQ